MKKYYLQFTTFVCRFSCLFTLTGWYFKTIEYVYMGGVCVACAPPPDEALPRQGNKRF